METEKREKLEALGVDVDDTLKRFMGNEELYLKFAKRAGEDPAAEELKQALGKRDHDALFRSAHTLKGVAANLGFSHLKSAAEKAVCLAREESADWDQIAEACEAVEKEMNRVLLVTNTL